MQLKPSGPEVPAQRRNWFAPEASKSGTAAEGFEQPDGNQHWKVDLLSRFANLSVTCKPMVSMLVCQLPDEEGGQRYKHASVTFHDDKPTTWNSKWKALHKQILD